MRSVTLVPQLLLLLALVATAKGQVGSLLDAGVGTNGNIANVGSGVVPGGTGNVAQVGGCAAGLVAVCTLGVCSCVLPGSGTADPILSDFEGKKFEFFGEGGEIYNLYSDHTHQVNMKLFPGFVDGHNGTYMNAYGIAFHHFRVNITLLSDGDITVETWKEEDKRSKAPETRHTFLASGESSFREVGVKSGNILAVETEPFRPWSGRTVSVNTGILQFNVWSVPAGTVDRQNVSQPAYLNFNITLLSPPDGDASEGIIGESLQRVFNKEVRKASNPLAESLPSSEAEATLPFDGKGQTADYRVNGLFGTDCAFNQFGTKPSSKIVARRAMIASPYAILHFPLGATSAA